jgi:hypothetical protein
MSVLKDGYFVSSCAGCPSHVINLLSLPLKKNISLGKLWPKSTLIFQTAGVFYLIYYQEVW